MIIKHSLLSQDDELQHGIKWSEEAKARVRAARKAGKTVAEMFGRLTKNTMKSISKGTNRFANRVANATIYKKQISAAQKDVRKNDKLTKSLTKRADAAGYLALQSRNKAVATRSAAVAMAEMSNKNHAKHDYHRKHEGRMKTMGEAYSRKQGFDNFNKRTKLKANENHHYKRAEVYGVQARVQGAESDRLAKQADSLTRASKIARDTAVKLTNKSFDQLKSTNKAKKRLKKASNHSTGQIVKDAIKSIRGK